ncbi:hypothetical protein AAEX63_02950 [Luteococcus sp. H138]|uniref:hypothetical protein n=1 Tax=unclassified Luteococcus TaxID=2639923 RepID=UPI00313D1E50
MPADSGADFASVLSEAIKARGLSLERIRHRLEQAEVKVSVATLSYWQNGRSLPARAQSQRTLTALEGVLELAPGTLTSMAPVAYTRRRSARASELLVLPHSVEDALEHADLSATALRTISTHVTLTLTADRAFSSEVVRKVVQCVADGTRSFPVVVDDSGLASGAAGQEVQGLSNCTVGRRFHVRGDSLVLTEMLLPRPLRMGELVMLEYMTALKPGSAGQNSSRTLGLASQRMSELVLEVQFPERDLPSRVVGFSTDSPTVLSEDESLAIPGAVDLPLAGGLAQLVRVDVTPGVHLVRWEW